MLDTNSAAATTSTRSNDGDASVKKIRITESDGLDVQKHVETKIRRPWQLGLQVCNECSSLQGRRRF